MSTEEPEQPTTPEPEPEQPENPEEARAAFVAGKLRWKDYVSVAAEG